LLLALSIQFRRLIILALGPGGCADACPQAREACLGLRSKFREHLPIASIDLGKNFIDSRKHSVDNLDRLLRKASSSIVTALYIPLAFFTATRNPHRKSCASERGIFYEEEL
jgi:hypothetical protein